ncbi:cation:proton antiporter domain-containing protein [Microvirga lotononidis]|uniref:Kef-type K+ transport system, membrane component n=1 Tax=Microvirga lotononidis TaxID=864069 RepID=I4Z2Z3_9HYPH|nr:cation:proton antiporter [Microvirga lotononidis]EIM30585.1 Kef-type K+ transport system, membrane component [Microvirga lotononidis]WQO26413.1 cation:proton antiporter [Microvirga lotononidis]
MAAAIDLQSYQEPILFLATAGIVVPLFHRLRISPVLGFLAAGALLGPYGLGRLMPSYPWINWITFTNPEGTSRLAEFGVVFLLFTIGIELSWQRLRTLRRLVFGFGSLQVLLGAAILGLVFYAFRTVETITAATIVGLALALSSTAIVIPVLAERKRLNTAPGRASFSALLFQDLLVAPILFAIAVLDTSRPEVTPSSFAILVLQAVVALVLIIGLGRLILRPFFQLVSATKSPELFMAACLLVVLVTSLIAAVSGLSMALGAFIAGILLSETEYRRAIDVTIQPFKGLLLGVFFVSVGMSLDLFRFLEAPLLILSLAATVIAIKGISIVAIGRPYGLNTAEAAETALLLGPGGEFGLVILGAAMMAGLVPAGIGQHLLLVTTLTMVAIPLLARLGQRLGRKLEVRQPLDPLAAVAPPTDEVGRVIIAGYGRVGQLVAEMLERHKVPYLAIDLDPARVASERKAGKPVFYGDGTYPEFLRACGIDRALALVITLDTLSSIEGVVSAARQECTDITIVARARDARHATQLYELGVDDAVPETIEASLQLTEAVLSDIGVPMGLVIASIHERRDEFREILRRKNPKRDPDRVVFQARRRVGKAAPSAVTEQTTEVET